MNAFFTLIGQIFIIICVQSIIEMFINDKPYLSKILSIACYAGALYLLLQFVFTSLLPETQTLFRFVF